MPRLRGRIINSINSMSDDQITIEVDGKSLKAEKGQMLIEVTMPMTSMCHDSAITRN